MSCSEAEISGDEKPDKKGKFILQKMKAIRNLEKNEILAYIEKLHSLLKKNQKKLKRYKEKIKKLQLKSKTSNANSAVDADKKEPGRHEVEEEEAKQTKTEDDKSAAAAAVAFDFVAEIRQAAEQAQNLNGFVYEPTSGLYYDQKTGYYYNAEYGLYYDGNNGCYYNYNQEKNSFEFHSQVPVQPRQAAKQETRVNDANENYVNDSLLECFNKLNIDRMRENALDIAKKYPPSLRIIVQETNLEQLKVGSLSLITFKGGSLGREGAHDVIIPDVNVSKFHLKFSYDTKRGIYKCTDLGSRNGTILNGTRMCSSKTESEAHDLVHGSVLQIAQTRLLCHVHKGHSTCGLCEPGLLIDTQRDAIVATANTSTVPLTHREQLKKLQKKYGLENEKFVDGKSTSGNYNDRAATRRTQVGSSTDKEKTQSASVNTEISSENKGFKMLSKLGWSKGEALGKTNTASGLLEPINVSTNDGKRGLGCAEKTPSVSLTITEKKKIDTWKKAQERYNKTADIFTVSDDDDSN